MQDQKEIAVLRRRPLSYTDVGVPTMRMKESPIPSLRDYMGIAAGKHIPRHCSSYRRLSSMYHCVSILGGLILSAETV